MGLPKGAKVFNVIRDNMNNVYLNTLPSATENNIMEISNVLFNDAYQPMLNEFVTNLINRIALTIIRNKSFNNPLKVFKKGNIPLGTDIQDIYENPAEAEQYELSNTAMARLLTITDPDTHVAYYKRNRKDLYTKTISRETLQGAFVSWEKFEDYLNSITNSLYSGNYISEFKYTKALIDGAYKNNKVIVEKVDAVVDKTSAEAFIKKARALYNKMKFPSTKYNAYTKFSGAKGKIETWTNEDRIVLITTADVMAEVDVDVLAKAFNIDNTKFLGRVIEIDNFENPEIQAILCDETWLQIYDNVLRFEEFYNARVMAWNQYLHAWGTYAICPFANAIVFATEKPNVPATEVKFKTDIKDLSLTSTPNYKTFELTIKPTNSNEDITFTTTTPTIISLEKISNTNVKVIPLKKGDGTLTATTTSGKTDTINIKVND